MRLKVALAISAIGMALVVLAFWLTRGMPVEGEGPVSHEAMSASPASVSLPGASHVGSAPPKQDYVRQARQSSRDSGTTNEGGEALVERALDEIDAYFDAGDQQALAGILAKLEHADKRVRAAAIDAIIKLDHREAIPSLKAAAERTADPTEKAAIANAIDYLETPSLTEYLAQLDAQQAQPEVDGQGNTNRIGARETHAIGGLINQTRKQTVREQPSRGQSGQVPDEELEILRRPAAPVPSESDRGIQKPAER